MGDKSDTYRSSAFLSVIFWGKQRLKYFSKGKWQADLAGLGEMVSYTEWFCFIVSYVLLLQCKMQSNKDEFRIRVRAEKLSSGPTTGLCPLEPHGLSGSGGFSGCYWLLPHCHVGPEHRGKTCISLIYDLWSKIMIIFFN